MLIGHRIVLKVVQASMPLTVRSWACDDCGAVHDRDHIAARNLERLAASSAVSACGELRYGAEQKPPRETQNLGNRKTGT
jgi:transposase